MIGYFFATFFALAIVAVAGFFYWRSKKLEEAVREKEEAMSKRMYELSILKELGERVGYSLDVSKIVDIITGSLNQFLNYDVVSYMLIQPEKIIFRVHIEHSVARTFIDDVRERMLESLSALHEKTFKPSDVEETLSGALLIDNPKEPVRSYFNIPLVIGGKALGVLTVAHTRAGLYKEEDMTILYKITNQASNAVSRLQEVVRTEQGKVNSMVESMTEGVVMTDTDYRIVVINPAAKRAVGIPENKEDVNIFDFISRLDGKFAIRGRLEESMRMNKLIVVRDILLNDRFYQIIVSPVKNVSVFAKEELLGAVILFHDITSEKEVERVRDEFTSMIVHELRTPLDGIRKMVEFLRKKGIEVDPTLFQDYTGIMHENSIRMLELVNDLLDIAKLEAGKFQIFRQDANVRDIIRGSMRLFEQSAQEKNINFSHLVAENVPEMLSVDQKRVGQVLNNLISNALKFTEQGGTIRVQAFQHKAGEDIVQEIQKGGMENFIKNTATKFQRIPDSLVVSVSDTGTGMAQDLIPQLFNKFKQFEAAARSEKKGTGLGLAIAKGIVEAHGGAIGIESEEGIGSTFYVTIPLESPKNGAGQEKAVSPEEDVGAVSE